MRYRCDALVVVTEWAEFRTLDHGRGALRMDSRRDCGWKKYFRSGDGSSGRGLIIRGLGGGSLWLAGLRL